MWHGDAQNETDASAPKMPCQRYYELVEQHRGKWILKASCTVKDKTLTAYGAATLTVMEDISLTNEQCKSVKGINAALEEKIGEVQNLPPRRRAAPPPVPPVMPKQEPKQAEKPQPKQEEKPLPKQKEKPKAEPSPAPEKKSKRRFFQSCSTQSTLVHNVEQVVCINFTVVVCVSFNIGNIALIVSS